MLKKCITKCIYILELLGILTIHGCSKDQIEVPNKVILIFQPGNGAIYLGQNLGINVKYIDDYLIPHEFKPGEFKQNKYVIPTSREQIDIECYYKSATAKHFLFRNGDSVRIILEEKWPVAEILNRKINKYESNFEKNKQQDLYYDKPSALEDYYYYWNHTNNPISQVSGSLISEELYSLKEKAISELDQESFYIDSLIRFEVISQKVAKFYLQKNEYEEHKLKLFENDKIDFSKTEKVESIISNINTNSTDSVRYISLRSFYNEFVKMYYDHFLVSEMNSKSKLDSLLMLEDYSTPFGKSLLFRCIDQLLISASVQQGQKLLSELDNGTLEETWLDYFNSKYSLDQTFSTDWGVSDIKNYTRSFNNLLQENQGNLLYVDFWASWCLLSIKEMPALQRLHKKYLNKPIEIVHISVDTNFDKWKWAETEYLGFNKYNSFILDSLDLPTVRETFAMDSLPKYLLFNQHGGLIHGNAPKPSDERLIRLLDRHLVE